MTGGDEDIVVVLTEQLEKLSKKREILERDLTEVSVEIQELDRALQRIIDRLHRQPTQDVIPADDPELKAAQEARREKLSKIQKNKWEARKAAGRSGRIQAGERIEEPVLRSVPGEEE